MATVVTTLAVGSTVTAPYYDVTITKQLCTKTSAEPSFNPVFSVVEVRPVGTNQYEAVMNVQGVVSYTPCGGSCCAKNQLVNENFIIPIFSATVPTVTATSGTPINRIIKCGGCGKCSQCGNTLVSNIPLTLTIA